MSSSAKVVLITGCSDGGIGSSLAREFCMKGCRVFATARNVQSMSALVPLGVDMLTLDVSSDASITSAVEALLEKAGRIDILVNNAGVSTLGPLIDTPLDAVRSCFEVNLFGALRLSQIVAAHMVKQRSGTIANIGTCGAFGYGAYAGPYLASKAALHKYTHCMRVELRPFGVNVVLVTPGVIKSRIGSKIPASSHFATGSPYARNREPLVKSFTELTAGGPFCSDTDGFARGVVSQVLKGRPPRMVVSGCGAMVAFLMGFLPLWLNDWISAMITGINKYTV